MIRDDFESAVSPQNYRPKAVLHLKFLRFRTACSLHARSEAPANLYFLRTDN
jgi:hypothetical protein